MFRKLTAAFSLFAAMIGSAHSVVLTQGALTVNIRDDNAAINNVTFMGTEYYRLGVFVADFGFQNGTSTGTFMLFDTFGSGGGSVGPVIGGGTTATALASVPTIAGLAFQRTYTLLNGNALRIDTTLINASGSALTVRLFDTLDPDQGTPQGIGPSTVNDVFTTEGVRVGTSTAGARSVAFASGQAGAVIGYGNTFGLGIDTGSELNAFFTAPFDPNGLNSDIGVGVGIQEMLDIGEVFTFTYVQGFGINAVAAVDAALPQPSVLALLGAGLLLLGWARRSNRA